MAACTHRVTTTSTLDADAYTSGSFTPAASDLLVALVAYGDNASPITNVVMTDTQGLGFALIDNQLGGGAANLTRGFIFVAKALAAASSMTVTFDTQGAATPSGAAIFVCSVSGMSRLGALASVQTAKATFAAAGTPAATFGASVQTGNPTLGLAFNVTNPAGLTPPFSWTEQADTGYATPTTGAEYVTRDSGFTGTTVTWGSTSATSGGVIGIELDTSAAPAGAISPPPVHIPFRMR